MHLYLERAPDSGTFNYRGEVEPTGDPAGFARMMKARGLRVVTAASRPFEKSTSVPLDELEAAGAVVVEAQVAGFYPDEAEALIANLVFKRVLTDRDADLELGLFTNVAPGETITHAAITEPTGTGYARKTLTDASWTGAADARAYAEQTFTGGAGGWTGSIQGYFIATKAAGGTKRLVIVEVDPNGPYTIAVDDTYKITPNTTVVQKGRRVAEIHRIERGNVVVVVP